MTTRKTFKGRVRARMAKTGERYTAARRNLGSEPRGAASPPEPEPSAEPSAAAAPSTAQPPVSDDAVRKATGRGWDEWFAILDYAGADAWPHPDIARWVVAEHGISGWWAQSVTVGYERARGRRAEHERPSGFTVNASKTVNVPVERLFDAFEDADQRAGWLDHDVQVRTATAPRSMRFDWGDGSRVAAVFTSKGPAKSQVALQQDPLPDASAVEELRAFWRPRLAALKARLESEAASG